MTLGVTLVTAQTDPGIRLGPDDAGGVLSNLTPGQKALFDKGKDAFVEIDGVPDGLGPRFNSDSCASCHAFPVVGGTSPARNPQIAVAMKLGANNRIPAFITPNGPVREVRFKKNPDQSPDGGVHGLFVIAGRSDAPGCRITQEDFSNTSNLSFRIPTPTFGLGLIEAIPDQRLRDNLAANAGLKASLGISGRLNVNGNDETVTRFGWKAQNKSLVIFSGEAYNVEQGVNNTVFPQERDETPGCVYTGSLEDRISDAGEFDDIPLFAAFMRFLDAPDRGRIDFSVLQGASSFNSVGCNLCHTPSLETGPSSVRALANKTVALFSDVAVHNMGTGLADGISQGIAGGNEFRTAPLWGLGKRIFLLHDGRTTNLLEAIAQHSQPGSEANAVIAQFNALTPTQKQNVLNFLRSL